MSTNNLYGHRAILNRDNAVLIMKLRSGEGEHLRLSYQNHMDKILEVSMSEGDLRSMLAALLIAATPVSSNFVIKLHTGTCTITIKRSLALTFRLFAKLKFESLGGKVAHLTMSASEAREVASDALRSIESWRVYHDLHNLHRTDF